MNILLEKSLVGGVIFLIFQLLYGLMQTPAAISAKPVAAVLVVVGIYLVLAFRSPVAINKLSNSRLKTSLWISLTISCIYIIQIVSEYLFPVTEKIDEIWGYIAFGLLPLWFGLAGIKGGIISAIWSAMISSLVWINVLLLSYFIFFNTPQEYAVLKAGGTIADFQRSGMGNLHAFVLQDYMGATFFHLLLSIVAAILFGYMAIFMRKTFSKLTKLGSKKY